MFLERLTTDRRGNSKWHCVGGIDHAIDGSWSVGWNQYPDEDGSDWHMERENIPAEDKHVAAAILWENRHAAYMPPELR